MRRRPCFLLPVIVILLITLAVFWLAVVIWVFSTWPHLQLEELIYELRAPLAGTGGGLVSSGLISCLTPTALCLIAAIILFFILKNSRPQWLSRAFFLMSAVALFLFASTTTVAADRLNVLEYLRLRSVNYSFIEDNYVYPYSLGLEFPEKKRNLIYIFLESMETTYADTASGGAFEQNVIPELTKIAMEHEDFSGKTTVLNGARTTYETTWTMAAMFAHSSGLPLKIHVGINLMDTQEHFFPDLVTLGDILENEGYQQMLMVGSDAIFGGRTLYYKEHGDFDIFDYKHAIAQGLIPPDYYEWWGYEDVRLFEYAKQEITRMAANDAPFHLSLLTVDTHFEDGYICSQCPSTFANDRYSTALACSSKQLAAFISWLKQQDFYEDTAIVLVGDHLTMDADYCADVPQDYDRRVYTAFINAAKSCETDERRDFCTMDFFPTTLSAMGVRIEGDRLGLGTDLFSSTPTLIELYGFDQMDFELRHRSLFMEYMSGIHSRFAHDN